MEAREAPHPNPPLSNSVNEWKSGEEGPAPEFLEVGPTSEIRAESLGFGFLLRFLEAWSWSGFLPCQFHRNVLRISVCWWAYRVFRSNIRELLNERR